VANACASPAFPDACVKSLPPLAFVLFAATRGAFGLAKVTIAMVLFISQLLLKFYCIKKKISRHIEMSTHDGVLNVDEIKN
jgi:hypothetical protein